MKKSILNVGMLFFLLISFQSYSQRTIGKLVKNKADASTQLTITTPTNNGRVSSPLTITGTASKDTNVSISVKAAFTGGSQDLGTFMATSNSNGTWESTPINLWAPEDAKNLRFEILASESVVQKSKMQTLKKSSSKKITVFPVSDIQTIARVELTDNKVMELNPTITKMPEKVSHGPIDPLTGHQRTRQPSPSVPNTYITSPIKNTTIDIPIMVTGTAQKNSKIKVIVSRSYTQYGQNKNDHTNLTVTSDENGNWNTGKLYSVQTDEADANVTMKISAVRIVNEQEKGNTDTVTVTSEPKEKLGIKITSPKSNLYQGEKVTSPITVSGRAIKNHTLEIRVQTGQSNASNYQRQGNGRLIKDWTSVPVNSSGHWSTQLNTGKPQTTNGRASQDEYKLTILIRDKSKPSEIKVLHLRR